jgi:hypothetical protein
MYEAVWNEDDLKDSFYWKVVEKSSGKVVCYVPNYYEDPEGVAWGIMAALAKADIKVDLSL